ncbi:MAG: TIGR03435 family protein [Acidobacteriota bacterium]|nr:TIGR03435 family protein [Acidobacteriota bacterium]
MAGWIALAVPSSPAQAGAATTPASSLPANAPYVPTMTFDVASVRESKPDVNGGFRVGGGFQPPNSSNLRLENNDLMNLILGAYEVNPHLIEGIPCDLAWATFNVEAKADGETDAKLAKLTKEQVRLEQENMMQVLLAERFMLKVHWETRDGQAYDLVVAKAGKLQSSGAEPSAEELKRFGDRPVPPLYQQGDSRYGFHYIAHGATTGEIAGMLAMQMGRPVSDKTGLSGKYDSLFTQSGSPEMVK